MSKSLTIARRELGTYFNSPIAYIVITVFLLFSGFMFFSQLFLENNADLRPFFGWAPLALTFFAPAITMRLLAEERGQGTFELLATLPLTDWQVVLGKFLGAAALLGVALGLTLAYPITVSSFGQLDKGPVIGGYLGLLLMGGSYLAIGLMASSWTRSQIVAFILAWGISFSLFILGRLAVLAPKVLQPFLEFISLDTHFQSIARGVVDTRDLLYYGSLILGCLTAATYSLESRKWR